MGFVESLKSVVGGDGDAHPRETFTYRCANCDERFERPKDQMYSVRCPSCRSADVRDATD
jgi:Zn finger protein HypA/HybF involved in hydrogenase expression